SGISRYSNEVTTSTLPVELVALTLVPATVTGGGTATATLTLDGPAPEGGAVIGLGNSLPEVAQAPASVRVPEGTTSATFAVTTTPVTAPASARLLALYGIRYGN